jgi:hypothetical protein
VTRFLVEYVAAVLAAAIVLVALGEDATIIAALAAVALVGGVTCARAGYAIARDEAPEAPTP